MGGHGALTLYLRHPELYKSVSAFAPISNPVNCPWGQKAFAGYLGEEDKEAWKEHDATELIRKGVWKGKGDMKALVDVGLADGFYKQGQLLPENLEAAAKEAGVEGLTVRYHEVSWSCVRGSMKQRMLTGYHRVMTIRTTSFRPSLLSMSTMQRSIWGCCKLRECGWSDLGER